MIAWTSDNPICREVMSALANEMPIKYIREFGNAPIESNNVFYGILRGSGRAIHLSEYFGIDYYYIDNGYFEAEYIDLDMRKVMSGKLRIVKNDLVEEYKGQKEFIIRDDLPRIALLLPPSVHAANHFGLLPDEWIAEWSHFLIRQGYRVVVRPKGTKTPIEQALDGVGLVLSMHSMACMKAIERGIPVYDTRGIFRNAHALLQNDFKPVLVAGIENVRNYYELKQYTLDEIRAGKVVWN